MIFILYEDDMLLVGMNINELAVSSKFYFDRFTGLLYLKSSYLEREWKDKHKKKKMVCKRFILTLVDVN